MEDERISYAKPRLLLAGLLPLALGGCGLPIGVTIASFVADGISLATTEKTLTDHAISAVAQRDCAVWRGLKGDDICREAVSGPVLAAADGERDEESPEPDEILIAVADAAERGSPADASSPPQSAADQPAEALANFDVAAGGPPDEIFLINLAPPQPAPLPITKPSPVVTGGTFYVIASFSRQKNAARFAGGQKELAPRVLAGTARGRPVFRVAVGPIAKSQRNRVRARLKRAGFKTAWPVHLTRPRLVIEVAMAN